MSDAIMSDMIDEPLVSSSRAASDGTLASPAPAGIVLVAPHGEEAPARRRMDGRSTCVQAAGDDSCDSSTGATKSPVGNEPPPSPANGQLQRDATHRETADDGDSRTLVVPCRENAQSWSIPPANDSSDGSTVVPKKPAADETPRLPTGKSLPRKGKRQEADDKIRLGLLEEAKIQLFTDQNGLEWARVPVRAHHETYRLAGKAFRNWMIRRRLRDGERIGKRQLNELVMQLEALADEDRRELSNRFAWCADGSVLHIDLADEQWRAVRVWPGGWAVESDPPSVFRRFGHQMPLPEPDRAGHAEDVLKYFPPLAPGDALLLLIWLILAPVPIPRPVLVLVGPHGSGKSTFSSFLRRLVDPSRVELLGRDARSDLRLIFQKHAAAAFDNMDGLSPQEADVFCQAVTGGGLDRRKLYTDDDDFILSFRRAVIINGLHPPTNRPDFLDRALILDLERLTPEQRRVLAQVEADFAAARPRMFGGLLNALAGTLERLPAVSREGLSRMADFHRMGRAAAEALGRTATDFDQAYQAAEARQKRGAFDNTLALSLLLFARQVRRWQGTPEALLKCLRDTAREHQVRESGDQWPQTPVGLGRQLKHLGETLARHGVRIDRLRRTSERRIVLTYDPACDEELEQADEED